MEPPGLITDSIGEKCNNCKNMDWIGRNNLFRCRLYDTAVLGRYWCRSYERDPEMKPRYGLWTRRFDHS